MEAINFSSAFDDGYRFGFNGKEKDTEFSNESYDFGARIYDGRVARWLSVDPLAGKYPEMSGYSAFAANPIMFIDPGGETLRVHFSYETEVDGKKKTVTTYVDFTKIEDLATHANHAN